MTAGSADETESSVETLNEAEDKEDAAAADKADEADDEMDESVRVDEDESGALQARWLEQDNDSL